MWHNCDITLDLMQNTVKTNISRIVNLSFCLVGQPSF